MGQIFFWMTEPYDPQVALEDWEKFIDYMGWASLLVIGLAVFITFLGYAASASGKKIHRPADLFDPYTPMYWLLTCLPAAVATAIVCWLSYGSTLGEAAQGSLPTAMTFAVWTLAATLVLSYLACAFIPGATPLRFKYRPFAWFMKDRGVRK